jgi:hypothetical protein
MQLHCPSGYGPRARPFVLVCTLEYYMSRVLTRPFRRLARTISFPIVQCALFGSMAAWAYFNIEGSTGNQVYLYGFIAGAGAIVAVRDLIRTMEGY